MRSSGRLVCCMGHTAHRIFSSPTTLRPSLPLPGRCTTTLTAPAYVSSAPSHDGHVRTAAEAGLHPSNIHDNAYAIGAIDYTGDMPILLGPDGPSLGGFVCPVVIAHAELWKMGQLRPGDLVCFRRISELQARQMDGELEAAIAALRGNLPQPQGDTPEPAVLRQSGGTVYRASGDRYLLVEIGPHVLDMTLRLRVHVLEEALRRACLPGVIDITPGMRSLQVHYDSRRLRREALMDCLSACEAALPDLDE